ncbi:MAG: RNA-binding cell elongation regulator Jag/EloR [Huintestinicola sp.]|uniref:RNA-binding cell elongation regulator Jag/EloR n=1 Tax=Huintestinicola sp. TaxID=2981661 RepID=UPI003EFFA4F5
MKKEFTANTVEEAKDLAAAEFGADKSKIKFTVLEEEKKGFLGFGKTDAKILAEYEPSKAETAAEYIKAILSCMDIEAGLEITENEEGAVIDITGDTTGAVIGRRGETLDAIQYLASMAANRSDKEYYRITLDSCGYREKRKAILEDLARKISKTVLRTGRTSTLEPMNPYERRIIHAAVSEIEGVTSKSIGEEPYRKVVISSVNGRPERRQGGGRKGGYDKSRRRREPQAHSMDLMKTSFEKDYKKPKPEDSMTDGELYGKIEL